DQDMRQGLHAAMAAKGVRIILTDVVEAIRKLPEGGLEARTMKGKVLTSDVGMLALGRAPNTSGLGLEAAGVETTVHGAIKVDA
ncbi:FAD-dependent oxidoreductase, partial [Listeria monocytogenes]|uniref:FAD-dependent oxidoreductase n=1 Tax=Listeria monocytogenes TaxID=1639 RepID=UPI001A91884E